MTMARGRVWEGCVPPPVQSTEAFAMPLFMFNDDSCTDAHCPETSLDESWYFDQNVCYASH